MINKHIRKIPSRTRFKVDPTNLRTLKLKIMRTESPIAYVPQFDATLITKRHTIFENEKK